MDGSFSISSRRKRTRKRTRRREKSISLRGCGVLLLQTGFCCWLNAVSAIDGLIFAPLPNEPLNTTVPPSMINSVITAIGFQSMSSDSKYPQTIIPSLNPSAEPSESPHPTMTLSPSAKPSLSPSPTITPYPTLTPSTVPSLVPTITHRPSVTRIPTQMPTSPFPSLTPSIPPTEYPTANPSIPPTMYPTQSPKPSFQPSHAPSSFPSVSAMPSANPSLSPMPSFTAKPSSQPSVAPSTSNKPSEFPSNVPSNYPTSPASSMPTLMPSNSPTPNVTTTVKQSNIVMTLVGVDSTINMTSMQLRWQTMTSLHVRNFWNEDLVDSPVFVGQIYTRLLNEERVITKVELKEEAQIEERLENQDSSPLSFPLLLKLTYEQIISFTLLSETDASGILNTENVDDDITAHLVTLPFSQNPFPYTESLVLTINNSRPYIWFQDIYFSDAPTAAPTAAYQVPIEENRNKIIIVAVSAVGSLLIVVAGYVIYLIHFKGVNAADKSNPAASSPDELVPGPICSPSEFTKGNILDTRARDHFDGDIDPMNPIQILNTEGGGGTAAEFPETELDFDLQQRDRLGIIMGSEVVPTGKTSVDQISPLLTDGEFFAADFGNRGFNERLGESIEPTPFPMIATGPLAWSHLDENEIPGQDLVDFASDHSFHSSSMESDTNPPLIVEQENILPQLNIPGQHDIGNSQESVSSSGSIPFGMGNFQMEILDLE